MSAQVDPAKLPPLTSDDLLGRGVFSSGEARAWRRGADGGDRRTFTGGRGEASLSVDRLGYAPDEVMTAIGDRIAEGREGKRSFYGWAVVTVEDAARMRRVVHATPLLSNPYHADIVLHLAEGVEQQDARIEHAKDLADRAHWKERSAAG